MWVAVNSQADERSAYIKRGATNKRVAGRVGCTWKVFLGKRSEEEGGQEEGGVRVDLLQKRLCNEETL